MTRVIGDRALGLYISLPNGRSSWHIHRGDPDPTFLQVIVNHLPEKKSCYIPPSSPTHTQHTHPIQKTTSQPCNHDKRCLLSAGIFGRESLKDQIMMIRHDHYKIFASTNPRDPCCQMTTLCWFGLWDPCSWNPASCEGAISPQAHGGFEKYLLNFNPSTKKVIYPTGANYDYSPEI